MVSQYRRNWDERRSFRLKVSMQNGEIHIHGNRAGLRDLASVCEALSNLSDEAAKTAANHVISDYMNSAKRDRFR